MRKKLLRFEDNKHAKNLIQEDSALFHSLKGKWNKAFFEHKQPITLEVGAGRGEYTIGLAEKFPNRNFIGIDVKGDRLWYGSQYALQNNLSNVGFLRIRAEQLTEFFGENEVEEIWITFPGPRPKNTEAHRRLTHDRFLDLYKTILTPDGSVHVKTDSELVYTYTLQQIQNRDDVELICKTGDLYHSHLVEQHYGIQTQFEKKFLKQNKTIKYVAFRFKKPQSFHLTKRRISSIIRSLLRKS